MFHFIVIIKPSIVTSYCPGRCMKLHFLLSLYYRIGYAFCGCMYDVCIQLNNILFDN